jgi:hypothetical protein
LDDGIKTSDLTTDRPRLTANGSRNWPWAKSQNYRGRLVRGVKGKIGVWSKRTLNGPPPTLIESLQLIWGDAALELDAHSRIGKHRQSFHGAPLQGEISILALVRCKASLSHTVSELVYAYQLHSASKRTFYPPLESTIED